MDIDDGAEDYGQRCASYDWENGDYDYRYDEIDSPNLTGKESDSPRDEQRNHHDLTEGYASRNPPRGHHYDVHKVRLPRPNSPHRNLVHGNAMARRLPDAYPPWRAQQYEQPPRVGDKFQGLSYDNRFVAKAFLGRDGRLYKLEAGYPKPMMGRRYPVTVKTSRYCAKKSMTSTLNKKASMVCLPSTFRDDQRRSYTPKTKVFHETETARSDILDSHPIHSHGDVIVSPNRQTENDGEIRGEDPIEGNDKNSVKEFAKYLKPKVPASIRARRDGDSNMSTSNGTAGQSLKCSAIDSNEDIPTRRKFSSYNLVRTEHQSPPRNDENKDGAGISDQKSDLARSFNYETISRKIVPLKPNQSKSISYLPEKATTSLTTSLDRKPSRRSSKMLDDHGALELHRCKSYIVDLIDRALSRELGTVPRDSTLDRRMSPKKAIEAIGHHTAPFKSELCYEVTAALADSFVSSATAPEGPNGPGDESDSKNKICHCTSESSREKCFKQLRHLRWGHIKHIQHEIRRLADLEEFLDRIDESEI